MDDNFYKYNKDILPIEQKKYPRKKNQHFHFKKFSIMCVGKFPIKSKRGLPRSS
jgi:hypothetical protein